MKFNFRESKLLGYLNIAIVTLLTLGALFLIRDLISLSMRPDRKGTVAKKKVEPTRVKRVLQEYQPILSKNPFGFPMEDLKLVFPVVSTSVEATRPPREELRLIGTVAGPLYQGYAILSDSTGRQEVFEVGDVVFGQGRLKRVEKDRVYLEDNDQEIEIALMELGSLKSIPQHPNEGGEESSTSPARGTREASFMLDRNTLLEAINNPGRIMTQARLLPYLVSGKLEGFRLNEIRPGGFYQKLGLANGDVLLRINESDVSSPEAALQALIALRGMDEVRMDIVRGGSRMTLTYHIQ